MLSSNLLRPVAKVTRDRMVANWKHSEPNSTAATDFGSGYIADDACKRWMEEQVSPTFGFPDVARFKWAPIQKVLEERACPVSFAADEDVDEEEDASMVLVRKRQQEQMAAFLGKTDDSKKKPKRLPYYEKRGLQAVTTL
jgi:hypothetical protein